MPRHWRPTLFSHVPSRKRGIALLDFANGSLDPAPEHDGQFDAALAKLRAHLTPGPRLPGQCDLCAAPYSLRTCPDCEIMLRKEVGLLHRKHGPPPEDRVCGVCRHMSSKTLSKLTKFNFCCASQATA